MGRKSKKAKSQVTKRKKPARQSRRTNGLLVEKTWRVYGLPFLLTIVMLPLLIRGYSFANRLCIYQPAEAGEKYCVDYFLHGKEVALFAIVGLSLFFLLSMLLLGRKIVWSGIKGVQLFCLFLPASYIFLALISSLCSKYQEIVFRGARDLFQPFPVLLSYGILFYYGWYVTASGENLSYEFLHYVIRCCAVSMCLLGTIGILQLLGHDPMTWPLIRSLCGLDHAEILASSRIYMTLYHADYVGVYLAMMLPLVLSGFVTESGMVWKGIFLVSLALDAVCLLASQSRSGIAASITGLLLFGFTLLPQSNKGDVDSGIKIKRRFGLFPVLGLLAGGICLILGLMVFVNRMTGGDLMGRLFRYQEEGKITQGLITGIRTGEDSVFLEIDDRLLEASWEDSSGTVILKETKTADLVSQKEVSVKKQKALQKSLKKKAIRADALEGPVYHVTDQPFDKLFFWRDEVSNSSGEIKGYVFYDGDHAWFLCRKDGGYRLINHQGILAESVISPDAFPASVYGFASFRGYVWSKTIAGLPEVAFLGTGPDTFSLFFPNNDYAARHQIGQDDVIYNKPHCWYLQMAAETGLLSALFVTGCLFLYLIRFLKRLSGTRNRNQFYTGLAFLLGPALYMITGLANDSMILTAPAFWALLGIGEGILFRNERETTT